MNGTESPYASLVHEVDLECERLTGRYRSHLECRAGCSHCCDHDLTVFPVEGDCLADAIRRLASEVRCRLRLQVRSRREEDPCPLLLDDTCAVYVGRPIICRTQGLPLLVEAGENKRAVDFCPLNFMAPGAVESIDSDHLIDLESLNMKLATVNLVYAGLTGVNAGERRRVSDIILKATDGNYEG